MMLVVPGRPSSDALLWWVLSPVAAPPTVAISPAPNNVKLVVHALGAPADPPIARTAFLVAAQGLQADTVHELSVSGGGEAGTAVSRTLPTSLADGAPFTIAVGSCHCMAEDPGIHRFFPPKRHDEASGDPIRLRILCGDQIYMDMAPSNGSPIYLSAPDPWQRYPEQWRSSKYRQFLGKSPNLMMADDHEFWNDYPHGNAWQLFNTNPNGPLGQKAGRAFEVFQTSLNVDPAALSATPASLAAGWGRAARTFEVRVPPLSIFVLDTRIERTRYDAGKPGFAPELARAAAWIRNLTSPGVLVLSQPAVDKRASWFKRFSHTMGDVNLPDYDADFAALWDALLQADHDVLVVSGDIHWSRVYEVWRAQSERRVFELISSPLVKIPQGSAGLGEPQGKVEWKSPGGTALWVRHYAKNETRTYATATFERAGEAMKVRATAWGLPPAAGMGPVLLDETVFTLE